MENIYIVSITGCIGIGKSTVIRQLQDIFHEGALKAHEQLCCGEKLLPTFYLENTEGWVTHDGSSLLELYYKNKTKYATELQFKILELQQKEYNEWVRDAAALPAGSKKLVVCERSPVDGSDIFIFSSGASREDTRSFIEYSKQNAWAPNLTICLDSSYDEIKERTTKRNIDFEVKDFDYIHTIWKKYKELQNNHKFDIIIQNKKEELGARSCATIIHGILKSII